MATKRSWAEESFNDIAKQGFMKIGRGQTKSAKLPKKIVSCDDCQDWHIEGKHTKSLAERRAMKLATKSKKANPSSSLKNPAKWYLNELKELGPTARSNKIARDMVHAIREEARLRKGPPPKSILDHMLSVWKNDLTPGDVNYIKHHFSQIKGVSNNPGFFDSTSELVQEFHGRAPDSVEDVFTEEHIPSSLAELGELRELVVLLPDGSEEITVSFPEKNTATVLASAPGGTQYVLIGGDQSIDPKEFGIEESKEEQEWARKLVLGTLVSLTYFTDKHHLSGPKYQKDGCLYEHELGEEGGELPTLLYDPNNESLEIVGGSYITRAEGIRN